MKYAVFAVLLTVMQTNPPVPRQASNSQTDTRSDVKKEPQSEQSSAPNETSSNNNKGDAQQRQCNRNQPTNENQKESPLIRERTSVAKSWWDRISVIVAGISAYATLLLVLVGVMGICYAVKTLNAIERQAQEMAGQRVIMGGQLEAMRNQLAEMERQNSLVISKERAWIKVKIDPFDINQPNTMLGCRIDYSVICVSPTIASIKYAVEEAVITESKEPPTDAIIFGQMEIGPFIAPGSQPIKLVARTAFFSQVDGLSSGTHFLHFRGLISYQDFAGKERDTAFCYTWERPPVSFFSGEWHASGPPEANRET